VNMKGAKTMRGSTHSPFVALAAALFALAAWGQDKAPKPAPAPTPTAANVRIALGRAESAATPHRRGHVGAAQTTSGDILVTQPAPNTIVVTMVGSALAKGHLSHETSAGWTFELDQEFEVIAPAKAKLVLSMEAQVVGLLRSTSCCHPHGVTVAECHDALASVSCGAESIAALDIPHRAVSCGKNQVVSARAAPCRSPIVAGCYALHQTFGINVTVQKSPFVCKAVAAEFAPDRHFDRAQLGVYDALGGSPLKENGFRVTIKVVRE